MHVYAAASMHTSWDEVQFGARSATVELNSVLLIPALLSKDERAKLVAEIEQTADSGEVPAAARRGTTQVCCMSLCQAAYVLHACRMYAVPMLSLHMTACMLLHVGCM